MNSVAVLDWIISQAEPMALGVVQLTSQTRLTNNNWTTIRVKLSGQNKQQIVGPLRRLVFLSVRLRIKAWLWPSSQASHPYFTPIGSHRLSCPEGSDKRTISGRASCSLLLLTPFCGSLSVKTAHQFDQFWCSLWYASPADMLRLSIIFSVFF